MRINMYSASLATISLVFFMGCSNKMISKSSITELHPSEIANSTEIKAHSLMQQLQDAGDRSGMKIVFSTNSSDRYIDDYAEGNLFDILLSSSKANGDIIKITTDLAGVKHFSIKQEDGVDLSLKGNEYDKPFSATEAITGAISSGGVRMSVSHWAQAKVRAEAIAYEEESASARGERNLYTFSEYLSSSFAKDKEDLYFGYNGKDKILFIDTAPIELQSTPYKLYSLKKALKAQGSEFVDLTDSSIAIKGSFGDWVKAYNLKNKLSPYGSNKYLVSSSFGLLELKDGYSKENDINIEFLGWEKDGSRSYMFYRDGEMRKITSSQRTISFLDKGQNYTIKFY